VDNRGSLSGQKNNGVAVEPVAELSGKMLFDTWVFDWHRVPSISVEGSGFVRQRPFPEIELLWLN
jgi:hypothetical protein